MKRISVRTSLAVLVLGCVLPVTLVAALLISNFYEHGRAEVAANAVSRARSLIALVDRDIATTQAALTVLSTSPLLAADDFKGFHARAAEALKSMAAENIVLVNAQSRLLLTTRIPYGEPLPLLINPPLLERTLKTGLPGVSDLFTGPIAKRPVITVAVPVMRAGAVIYSLNATIDPQHLTELLQRQGFPDTWRGTLIDGSGTIVARTHDIAKFLGKQSSPDVRKRIAEPSPEGTIVANTLDGIPVLIAFSRSAESRWTIAFGMPRAELQAALRRTLMWLILASLSCLTVSLWLAWFIGGRVSGSIRALAKPALALSRGERLDIPALHFREANEMAGLLRDAEKAMEQARHAAHHDGLTGLANRTLFNLYVHQQLALSRRNSVEFAVLYIDLDGFKGVNDTFGHQVGDRLLVEVAQRIKAVVRKADVVARLGGDEFAVVLVGADMLEALQVARKLIAAISVPFYLGTAQARVSASAGAAVFPESAMDAETLMKKADQSMYASKAQGKARVTAAPAQQSLSGFGALVN